MSFPQCSCDICKSMCERPCLVTPHEAIKLMGAGYGNTLSIEWGWNGDSYVLRMAKKGEGGYRRRSKENLKYYYSLTCELYDDKNGWCLLHDIGLKPIEGKTAMHPGARKKRQRQGKIVKFDIHDRIRHAWDNKAAQRIAEIWVRGYYKAADIQDYLDDFEIM